MKLATATSRPEQVSDSTSSIPSGPAPRRAGLSLMTSDESSTERAALSPDPQQDCDPFEDRAGFVVNALLIPTCCRRCGCSSPASPPATTSTPACRGCAHPMGRWPCATSSPRHHAGRRRVALRGVQRALYAPPPLSCGWSTPACSSKVRAGLLRIRQVGRLSRFGATRHIAPRRPAARL